VKELVDNGAIRVAKRKNAAGDWTSNLYTVLALPNGVASNLSLPRTRIAATGSAVNDARTKPNLNDRQELQKKQHQRLYPDPNTFVPPAQLTKDELLALAVEMTDLSATAKTRTQKAMFQRLADRFGEQAMEMDND
jgi:hypothetical protein